MDDEFNAPKVAAGAFQVSSGDPLVGFGVHQHSHLLARGNFAHHFAIDPPDRIELARPIRDVVRPPEPGGFVLFPFGGHGETELCRSLIFVLSHKVQNSNKGGTNVEKRRLKILETIGGRA